MEKRGRGKGKTENKYADQSLNNDSKIATQTLTWLDGLMLRQQTWRGRSQSAQKKRCPIID